MVAENKFLLIMPSYNQAHYISDAVNSVIAQNDQEWVLWIIDNSTDNTPDVMRRFSDERIIFIHTPERMDPGSCLNYVLERQATDCKYFSYIHTDNILRSDYVGRMRAALSQADDAIAYCDMKSINESGDYIGVFRRGEFDLARLFRFSTLGVPFSATSSLARKLGGFNASDVADDVIFCVRAWPRSKFFYIPDTLMDYRLHGDSRTTAHGGASKIKKSFLNGFQRVLSEMTALDADPLSALQVKLQQLQIDIQLRLEDIFYREGRIKNITIPEVLSGYNINSIFLFDAKNNLYKSSLFNRIKTRSARHKTRIYRGAIGDLLDIFRSHAVPWAYLSIGALTNPPIIKLASADIYTLWITEILHEMYNWRFQVNTLNNSNQPLNAWSHLDFIENGMPTPNINLSLAPGALFIQRC